MTLPLLGHLAAWQIALFVTGLPGIIIAFLVFLVPDPRGARRRVGPVLPLAPWSDVFRFMRENWAYLTCYILGFACLNTITYAQLAWLPAILQRSYGWSIGQIG